MLQTKGCTHLLNLGHARLSARRQYLDPRFVVHGGTTGNRAFIDRLRRRPMGLQSTRRAFNIFYPLRARVGRVL